MVNCRPRQGGHEFGLNILLTNTQSLAPKIDEVQSVMLDVKPYVGFLPKNGYATLSEIAMLVFQVIRLLQEIAVWIFIGSGT